MVLMHACGLLVGASLGCAELCAAVGTGWMLMSGRAVPLWKPAKRTKCSRTRSASGPADGRALVGYCSVAKLADGWLAGGGDEHRLNG